MNCAIHTESAATAYCRTCGKPMCDACKRSVRGVIYCEDCIAKHLADAMPPGAAAPANPYVPPPAGAYPPSAHGTPSPGLAALLGFIPGVGAMYNGQFMKALIHVLLFATFIWMADHGASVFGGILIPFLVFYMVFDAYKTARARELGQPLPDPFGLEHMFGSGTAAAPPPPSVPYPTSGPVASEFVPGSPETGAPVPPVYPPSAYPPAEYPPADPNADYYGAGRRKGNRGPTGAIILIGLGVVFLINTMGVWHWNMDRYWPVILIVIGIWLFARRLMVPRNFGGRP